MPSPYIALPEIQTEKPEVEKPPMFKVIMLNDDFTPMDFVVMLLQRIFHKNENEAVQIMLDIHHQGRGICGIFTRDIADTKIAQVHDLSKQDEHPLRCIREPV